MALGLMRKLLERGCRIPDDFAIAAMGDRLPISAYPVPLTVSDTDEEAQILKAADLLEDLIRGRDVNKKIKLNPKLIVRQSSGRTLKVGTDSLVRPSDKKHGATGCCALS